MENKSIKQHGGLQRKAVGAPSSGATGKPPDVTSNMLAVAATTSEFSQSALCLNLAGTLARHGSSLCLIDTDASLHSLSEQFGIQSHFSPIELQNETQLLEEILLEGPAGIQILPAASCLAEFIHLNLAAQQRMLQLLRQVERKFDQVLINISSVGSPELMLPLLLAAPVTVLSIPAETASLSAAFTLLKRLKHHFFEQPLYVLVNQVSSLSAAHDAFRRLNRVTSRYLQLEIRYLGYVLTEEVVTAPIQPVPPGLNDPESASGRCLEAVAASLLRQMSCEHPPGQRFSDYFARLLLQEGKSGQSRPLDQVAPVEADTQDLTRPVPQAQPSATDDERDLRSAMRYASTLARSDTPD